MRANSATRSCGRKVLIQDEPKIFVKHRVPPEVPNLDIQLGNGSVHVFSDRTLSIDSERGGFGPLGELTLDDYVRLPGVALQLDFDVSLSFSLFYK